MPLYFFHTQTETRDTDTEGTLLASQAEARRAAIVTCGQMMRDAPECFWGSRPWSVVVTNAAGLILWEIIMDGVASAAAHSGTP